MLSLRCQDDQCRKMLGKVDKDYKVHIKYRNQWKVEIVLEKGIIKCCVCGTDMPWDANKNNWRNKNANRNRNQNHNGSLEGNDLQDKGGGYRKTSNLFRGN